MIVKGLEKPGTSARVTTETRTILPYAALKTVHGTRRWERKIREKGTSN